MEATRAVRVLVALAAVAALTTCKQPFGPRANVHDPQGTWVVPAGGVSPADGAVTSDTTPLLDWADVDGATGYEVDIATSAAGLDAATAVAASESEYQVPLASVFALGDELFWRVRAVNSDGVGAPWSFAHQFTVDWTVDYGTPSPADGGTTSDTTPLLDWADVDGALGGYEVQIADSAAGLDAATPVATSSSQYQVPLSSAFAYGDEVYWRVRALNGDGVAAAWSATLQFTVEWTVDYGTPSPADSGVTIDTTPLLDWADVEGAQGGYEVAIADSAAGLDGATPVAVTESEYQVPAALAHATWYWRVRAVNEDDVAGAWSATWPFEALEPILDMVSVTGGTFSMGSSDGESNEQPVHDATISSFLISRYEVTQADYQTVIGSNPSYITGDTSRPVEEVSWYDAVAFCDALSALEGLASCYTINGTDVTCDFTKNGYRLPTEAEWEFAARGGTLSEGYTYSGSNTPGDVAWYTDNSSSTTHPVGTKAANELGICDMSGNVWEWCWDWYGSYGADAQTDPTGPTSGSARVLRGGSWYGGDDDGALRCAYRNSDNPADTNFHYGFRVVRRGD